MGKPILCLDFDGVIHSYSSGWKGADVIPDPPVPGAIEFIKLAMESFTVVIHSSRFNSRERRDGAFWAVATWLNRNHLERPVAMEDEWKEGVDWEGTVVLCAAKPPALMTIDDRAMTFTGQWPDLDAIKAFTPWTKGKV